jgi:prolipoprotein diacylglyceryltransferase
MFIAMNFGDNINRLPIQIIEATVMSSLFVLFWGLHRRGDFAGRRLFLFMMAYGIVRFVMEFYRAPIAINVVGIGSYQWLAASLFMLGLYQLLRRRPSLEPPTIEVQP